MAVVGARVQGSVFFVERGETGKGIIGNIVVYRGVEVEGL